jgi:hypothetical protein
MDRRACLATLVTAPLVPAPRLAHFGQEQTARLIGPMYKLVEVPFQVYTAPAGTRFPALGEAPGPSWRLE